MNKRKKIASLVYPSNFDPSLCPDEETRNQSLYIISNLIYWHVELGKTDSDRLPFLQSKELKKFLGRNYTKGLNYLIDNKVIETNDFYWYSAHHCKEYSICSPYREAEKHHYIYRTGDKFGEKLAKLKRDKLKEKRKRLSKETKAICISPEELKSLDKVYQWVYDTSLSRASLKMEYYIEADKLASDPENGEKRKKYWYDCGRLIKCQGYDPNISIKSGRLYYLGCSFPSDSRKYILIDGQETGEVDIVCAQPYFMGGLYNPFDESHMEERERYLEFIRTEDFYTGLNKAAGMPYEDRKAAKKGAYTEILFGSLKNMHMPLAKALKERFPILYWEIYNIKKNHPNPPEKKITTKVVKGQKVTSGTGNEYFAIKLQRMEADITFTVVEKLMERGIHCLTVHDSIRTQAQYCQLVYDLYFEECAKRIGVDPILSFDLPEAKAA